MQLLDKVDAAAQRRYFMMALIECPLCRYAMLCHDAIHAITTR